MMVQKFPIFTSGTAYLKINVRMIEDLCSDTRFLHPIRSRIVGNRRTVSTTCTAVETLLTYTGNVKRFIWPLVEDEFTN